MAFDEGLAQRIRERMSQENYEVEEKKMFGGIGFMIGGNLACGVIGDEMCVRVGPHGNQAALEQPHARQFDFTGKPMKGWIYVAPEGLADDEFLDDWIERGAKFASSLPKK